MKKLAILAVLSLAAAAALTVCLDLRLPRRRAPFWYPGGQLAWDRAHLVTPQGADEVSDFLIRLDGIRHLAWDRRRLHIGNGFNSSYDPLWEWEGDRLLVRHRTGIAMFPDRAHRVHEPLAANYIPPPDEVQYRLVPGLMGPHRSLRSCLDPADDGKIHGSPPPVPVPPRRHIFGPAT
jgi:hypothetical protein